MTRPSLWTYLVVALAFTVFFVPFPPGAIERLYSGLIYPSLQRATTTISNLFPFALFDVLIVGFPVAWLTLALRDASRARQKLIVLGRWLMRTVAAGAVLYLLFLGMWGFNYRRLPLERKLPYDARRVTADSVRDAATIAVSQLNTLYSSAHATASVVRLDQDATFVAAFAGATKSLGASGTTVPGRPKWSLLDLYFRPAGVAGMTDPYFLETLIESDLLPVERPFVIAHEWSHLAGFADEGEANFAGWLTCTRAGAGGRYSGWLFLFGELANAVPRGDRSAVIARLDNGPRDDLRAIAARLKRDVQPRVEDAGWRVYDRYLKANRVAAGAASYGQVVRLVLGTGLGLSAAEAASPAR